MGIASLETACYYPGTSSHEASRKENQHMPTRSPAAASVSLLLALVIIVGAGTGWALTPPQASKVTGKEYRHPNLEIRNSYTAAAKLGSRAVGTDFLEGLSQLGVAESAAYLDVRTGRWGTLMPSTPLLPGTGVGNQLTWRSIGPAPETTDELGQAAWKAFVSYLTTHRGALGIDLAELPSPGRVGVHDSGDLIQIHAQRRVNGVPVKDSYLTAVINHGNLVLLGATNWADVHVNTVPSIDRWAARAVADEHLAGLASGEYWTKDSLILVPMSTGSALETMAIGSGLDYRLAWSIHPHISGQYGRWQALVDAHSGELLAFEDTNHYASTRTVVGGVYPLANDGTGPEGTEQSGWPMPYADVSVGGQSLFTDSGGNLLACVDGDVTTTLSGRYLVMNDSCGAISETSATDLDLGVSGGIDCTVPAGSTSTGNTHASRSGFYEMTRIVEMAQAQLPDNTWLRQPLTSNMNLNSTCNAFWNGNVNFYRSGGGCTNTGEIAGVYDHEWGHGLDDNDVTGSIANPGEGIADIYASLRLNESCIGRGFLNGSNCNGYGDPCLSCDGVRDIDWAKRTSGAAHDISSPYPTGIDALCGSGNFTPCGGSTHCEGAVYAEAVYDLYNRDLQTLQGMDLNTAREVTTRLTYVGAGVVGTWFQCTANFGGCNGDGGYLNYLAADDDNGDLNDGTPNMSAIFAAFDRHEIACDSPTVQNSGCAGTPTSAPTVTATALDRGAKLSWGAVSGATKYLVYRAEGVKACDYGKTLVGETTGTSFTDAGLLNGRLYSYNVIPIGPGASCFGPASACTSVTPAAGVSFAIDMASFTVGLSGGDGDQFFDNCETAQLDFSIANLGNGTATNVVLTSVRSTSHPGLDGLISFTPAVSASLAACDLGSTGFSVVGADLAYNDVVEFEVCASSDQTSPEEHCGTLVIRNVESDLQTFSTLTYSFETDRDGWQVGDGTFDQSVGGGGNGTLGFIASSSNLDDQCDSIRSPNVQISATTTLSVWTNFDIEANSGQWWDRANFGLVDAASGGRTTVVPDGGRLYNASGVGGTCGTVGQAGWADSQPTWAVSTYSATALGSAALDGSLVAIEARYGTDPAVVGTGFRFDEVTLTDVSLQVPDAATCSVSSIFSDGFEGGNTNNWSAVVTP